MALETHDFPWFCEALDAGVDLFVDDPCTYCMLDYACMDAGNVAMVAELLRRGADVNGNADANLRPSRRPLHLAAFTGSCELLRMLIEAGAELNVTDEQAMTPLDVALDSYPQTRSTDAARLLVKAGAMFRPDQEMILAIQERRHADVSHILRSSKDLTHTRRWMDRPGNVLDWAAFVQAYEIVEELLKAGMPILTGPGYIGITGRDSKLLDLLGMPEHAAAIRARTEPQDR